MAAERRGLRKVVAVGFYVASAGMLYLPACSLKDIGQNVMSGALSFVEGYTEEVLASLFPPPGEIVDGG